MIFEIHIARESQGKLLGMDLTKLIREGGQ
jgi:hypothetical protein